MTGSTSVDSEDAPLIELDYDHDDLVALLHDLSALVERASVDRTRVRALSEARDLLRYFKKDMQGHFELEEHVLFPALRTELPEKVDAVDALARAHQEFTTLIGALDTTINDDSITKSNLADCRTSIVKLIARFESHSRAECHLAGELDKRVVDPARRRELRERLSGL